MTERSATTSTVTTKASRFFRYDDPRPEIAERVLLPVYKMLGRLNTQRVRQNWRAAVRRRAQAYCVGRHTDGAVVAVLGPVRQCGLQCHSVFTRIIAGRVRPDVGNGKAFKIAFVAASGWK